MNKLQRLKTEIERLPAKRKLAEDLGILGKYDSQTKNTFETLSQTQFYASNVKLVYNDIDLEIINKKIKQSAKIAKRLTKSLSDNIENIKKADKNIFDLESTAKNAANSLVEKWRSLLQNKIETYEKIVKAATDANLSGSDELTKTLEKLNAHSNSPPQSEEIAKKIADELESIANSIETLGLKGEVGEFLTAAAVGNATARMLLNPEVQKFIDQNNLWSALSVKFG